MKDTMMQMQIEDLLFSFVSFFFGFFVFFKGISYNTFGHAAVRYRHPDTGKSIIMNVEGLKDPFVRFHEPVFVCLLFVHFV